jgi:DNA invertase Pin-like site-specific DNA recombinase
MMLERQREGIEKARQAGKYKGRQPTARAKSKEVLKRLKAGEKPTQVAKEVGIARSSVYRIMDDARSNQVKSIGSYPA